MTHVVNTNELKLSVIDFIVWYDCFTAFNKTVVIVPYGSVLTLSFTSIKLSITFICLFFINYCVCSYGRIMPLWSVLCLLTGAEHSIDYLTCNKYNHIELQWLEQALDHEK